jgi:signal transduction histidine kinase
MRTATDNLADTRTAAPDVGGGLAWTGLLATLVACGVPLIAGLARGRPPAWLLAYGALALLAAGLSQAYRLPWPPARWLAARPAAHLLLFGLAGCALQALSGDPFIQPVVFTVPLVSAVLCYPPRRAALTGALLLGLMALGLWLGGARQPMALLVPLATYGLLMLVLGVFTRQAVEQAAARRRAAELAAALAHERDELARLLRENARLLDEAGKAAALAERNRLARELHDTIAQGLTAVTMHLEAAQRSFGRDPARARARLVRAAELARATLADVRRSVWALAEPAVDACGLPDALAELARGFTGRTGMPARYAHRGAPPMIDPAAATQVVRIVQEALHNIEKHAGTAHVSIETSSEGGGLRLLVCDDGAGFNPGALPAEGGGFGLRSMRERARLAGGTLRVESAPGSGTRVVLEIGAAGGA